MVLREQPLDRVELLSRGQGPLGIGPWITRLDLPRILLSPDLSAALTPAASAITRRPTLKPCWPHCSIAALRILAAAVMSVERMFSRLNTRLARGQGIDPLGIRQEDQ